LKSFRAQNLCFKINDLKMQFFWISQMTLDEKTIKIKVGDLDAIWNFVVETFFIWIHLGLQISFSKFGRVSRKGIFSAVKS
jgi:hypothetical protein